MKRAAAIMCLIGICALGLSFMHAPEGAFAETEDVQRLVHLAKQHIVGGDKEAAIAALDEAYTQARELKDYDALMEIGDLYISLDPALNEKAMDAWTEAGRTRLE